MESLPNPEAASVVPTKVGWSARVKRYSKRIVWACLAVVALIVVLAVLAALWIDGLAKAGIEYAGTRALGVPTTLDGIKIGIVSSDCKLVGFQVANPPGFKSPYFLRLDQGTLEVSLGNLIKQTVEIDQLRLSGVHINLVRESDGANFRTIIENIRRFETGESTSEERAADKIGRKKFIIREVVIQNVNVIVDLLPIGGELTRLKVPIEELRLQDVGSEKREGENLARITAIVVRALLDAVIAKGEGILPPETLAELTQKLGELKPLETLRAIRDNLRERREQHDVIPDRPRGPIRQWLKDRKTRQEGA